MRAGRTACAAVLAALTAGSAAGCTLANAVADSGRPAARVGVKPMSKPTQAKTTPPRPLLAGVRNLTVHGRSFLLFMPPHPRQPAPLVAFLGGIGSTARSELSKFRATAIATRAGAVVAYPNPIDGTWNAGGCCWGAKQDDAKFLSQMRSRIASLIPLDPARQVLIGYSNGGMMAYDAACADRHWTAIVALGASLTTRCRPTHPFAITNVNGELDTVAPWNGGWSGYARATMPPVWKIDQEFAVVFRCHGPSSTKSGADIVYTYVGCSGGVLVRDIRVPGLRHHWPVEDVDGYDMGPALWRLAGL